MAEAQLTNQLTRIESMTNVELRAELKQRGCPTSGNKKDLLIKLRTALQKEYEQDIQQSSINHSVGYTQNETPVTYTNLPNHDQVTAHHPSAVNLTIPQTVYPCSVPIIPISQQLLMSSGIGHQQLSSMNIPQVNTSSLVASTPEKKTRTRSKKSSVDSRSDETTSAEQSIINEQIILDTSINDINVEVQPFVSKSIEEKQNDIEKIGEKSSLSSVGNGNAKSDSIIEEIPLSKEPQRLNQSISQQQKNNQSITIDEEQHPVTNVTNNDTKNRNEVVDLPSNVDLSTNVESATTKEQDIIKSKLSSIDKEPEKAASQQQLKPSRSQIASFMKGVNRSTNNKINLSSEMLKTLIPDLSLASESVINDELDLLINDDQPILETNIVNPDSMTIGDLADQKHPSNRTVVMDVMVDSSSLNDDIMTRKKQTLTPARMSSMESKTSLDGKMNTVVTDEPVRIKNAAAVHEPPSQILYIRGLTRPFSLFQLKELLSRYGILVDGEFWLDKIKSQCFVTYNTLEEAQNAREALDGCRWPATNPKTLSVRFGGEDEFKFSKTHDLSPDQMTSDRVIQEQTSTISLRRSTSPMNGIKQSTKMNRSEVQESNKPKPQKDIQSGFLITDEEEEESVTINEPPAKELDDYFRKTKAKPSIYWLPLTEEQIIERTRRQEERKAERDVEQSRRELDENVRRSDSKSRHRSPSSREKRKHSSSPSKRDFKRH